MVAEDDDLVVRVELGGPDRDVAHREENRAFDPRDGMLGGLPHVEEQHAGTAAAGGGLRGTDLRLAQNPSSTLVTSDCAKRSASASIATFSRSE